MSEGLLRRPTAAALASSAALACLVACGVDWTVPAEEAGAGGSSDGGGGATTEASTSETSATSSPSAATTSSGGGAAQGVTTSGVTTGADGQGAGDGEGGKGDGAGSGETVTTGGESGCGDEGCEGCQVCAIDGGGPCREHYEACQGHEACAALVECAAGCSPEEEACLGACLEEFPEGADKADLLWSCVSCEVCADACGASPHC